RPTSPTPIVSEVAGNMIPTKEAALGMDAAPPPACEPQCTHHGSAAAPHGSQSGAQRRRLIPRAPLQDLRCYLALWTTSTWASLLRCCLMRQSQAVRRRLADNSRAMPRIA
ncbi:hypothetical protein TraAM80_10293, partial [Trypanosoma rangeli]